MNLEKNNSKNSETEIDFLFDEMSIRPITQGLGFHQEPKNNIQATVSSKKIIENKPIIKFEQKPEQKDFSMGDLEPFYKDSKREFEDIEQPIVHEIAEEAFQLAPNPVKIFSAWIVDVIFLTSALMTAIVASNFVVGLDFSSLAEVNVYDFNTTFLPIIMLMYLFYFTFMERAFGKTLGKVIFDLEVVCVEDASNLNLLRTFMSSVLSVISVLTFGLSYLLKINERLSGLKTIQRQRR